MALAADEVTLKVGFFGVLTKDFKKFFGKQFKNFRQLEIAAETNKTPPLTFWKFCVQGEVFCSDIP